MCEFCHANERWQYVKFTVDHVLPVSLGGGDNLDNLTLACFHCNRRKTNHLTAIDPESQSEVLLFNPRQDIWKEHFIWSIPLAEVVAMSLSNPAVKREYEAPAEEFQIAQLIIDMRKAAKLTSID